MGLGPRGIARSALGALALIAIAPAAAEAAPKLKVLDATAVEAGDLAFTLKLKPASDKKVRVAFATADGTAGAADYVAASGKAKLKPGEKKTTITVAGLGDSIDEPDETFTLELSGPRGAKIADGEATGTIGDDDAPAPGPGPGTPTPDPPPAVLPVLSIGSASVGEGNPPDPATTGPIVSLSAPSASDAGATFTVTGGTADGGDRTVTAGSVVIPAGSTTTALDLGIVQDHVGEADETISVTLSSPVNATVDPTPGVLTLVDDEASAGQLSITEFLVDPLGKEDAIGEWVEIANRGLRTINLAGLRVATCDLSGTIAPGGHVVASPDPLIQDVDCPASLALTDNDTIELTVPDLGPLVLDSVTYVGTQHDPGYSRSRDPGTWNFCNARDEHIYDGFNRGTPGAANPSCP